MIRQAGEAKLAYKEASRRIPIKYRRFTRKDYLALKKVIPVGYLLLLAVGFFLPNLALVLLLPLFLFSLVVGHNAPKPLFEKQIRSKPKEPRLYFGTDEYGFPIEMPHFVGSQHGLIVGSTGSGKTTLIRLMFRYHFRFGGGGCFVDGKADAGDMYQIFYAEVVREGREDDFYLINFNDPSQSHSINPFQYGTSDFLVEICTGLLKEAQGENEYWQGRAIVFLRAYMAVLRWLRDNREGFKLNIGTVNRYLDFNSVVNFGRDESIPLYDEVTGEPVRQRLIDYLKGLTPDWANPQIDPEEKAEAIRQFGYAVQQWQLPFDLLASQYGAIFNTDAPDIDIKDVVSNNRILYVLLPSLKQSPQTLQGIGRLIVSIFRIVFSELVGDRVIGTAEELHAEVEVKKPNPVYLLVLDEVGSYLPDFLDTILAQARSTRVSVWLSVQEPASLFKVNEVQAKRLLNNTKIKVCLAVDDKESARYFVDRAGEDWAFIPQVRREWGAFTEMPLGNIDGTFSYSKTERLMELDLYGLEAGQGYIIYRNDLREFRFPYVADEPPERLRLLRRVFDSSTVLKNLYRLFFRPVRIYGFTINRWRDDELEVLRKWQEEYFLFNMTGLNGDGDNDDVERFFEFESLIRQTASEMWQDTKFARMVMPDAEVWEEFKKILFSVSDDPS